MFKKDRKILNKRSKNEKILFGIVLACFILYACSLILPFFLSKNAICLRKMQFRFCRYRLLADRIIGVLQVDQR